MPWMETVPMDQRTQFIADHRQGLYPVTELCARYGLSRKTGYQCLDRFEHYGRSGLAARRRRRRPHQHPGGVPPTTHDPNDLWTADCKGHRRSA